MWQFRDNLQLRLLIGFFIPVTAFIGLLFLDAALSPYPRLFAVYAENTILALALVFLIQFAYRFPHKDPQHLLETRLALITSLAYLLWEGGFMVYRYAALFGPETVYFRPYFSAYANAVVLLWAPLAFARQSIAADTRSVSWPRKLWQPEGKGARGARTFVLVFGIIFVLGLINILRIFNLSTTFYSAAMSVGILVSLWLFSTNYIRFIPGRVGVQMKVLVPSLTIFLALLGLAGWFIAPPYISTFQPNLADHQTLRFSPISAEGYDFTEVEFNFETDFGERIYVQPHNENRNYEIDFKFPFYGQIYTDIFITNSGTISLGEPFWQPNMQACCATFPAIFPLMLDLDPNPPPDAGGGLYVRADAETERVIITWNHLSAIYKPAAVFTFQAVLYSDGVIEFTYNGLPLPFTFDPDATPSVNPWIRGIVPGRGECLHDSSSSLPFYCEPDQLAIIDNYQSAFRLHLHEFMLPLAEAILGGSLLLVVGLPLLLRNFVIQPLRSLTANVRKLDDGNRITELPPQYEDEIDYLTGAFNTLSARLDEGLNSIGDGDEFSQSVEGDGLSPRQWQVLEKVAEGYSYKETGEALFITERTVKYHMGKILTTLNLKNKREAVRYFRGKLHENSKTVP